MGERRDYPVELDYHEMMVGALVGVMRNVSSIQRGSHTRAANLWTIHIEGACGELATAKVLKRYWPARVNTYRSKPDIDPDIEVRTRSQHDYELKVGREEDPDQIYVLVTGKPPHLIVRGWLRGRDAHRSEWLLDPARRGGLDLAYYVPHEYLHDISELIEE